MYRFLIFLLSLATLAIPATPSLATSTARNVAINVTSSTPPGVEVPGPSLALFNNPYYTCVRNLYVATNGNDANNGTSPSTPWRTIAHYESAVTPTAGDCVNVAPGTYAAGNNDIQRGGSSATATGYITYRCTTMDGCTITAGDWAFAAGQGSDSRASYLIFDGFVLAANGPSGNSDGVECSSNNFRFTSLWAGCHHWMVLNSIVSNHELDGIHMFGGEYFLASHNTVYGNAYQCGVYGSGISFVSLRPVQSYTPTADDTNANNNAALNLIGLQGPASPFHNVVAWNVVYNNAVNCNGGNVQSDGNGISMDSFLTTNGNTVDYAKQTLLAFNVVYNNGGQGLKASASDYVTFANNTCFNNSIDPFQSAVQRGCIVVDGKSWVFPNTNVALNNIAYSLPTAGCIVGGRYSPGYGEATSWGDDTPGVDGVYNSPGHNITDRQPGPTWQCGLPENSVNNNPAWDCTVNLCTTDPLWVAVSGTGGNTTSTGSENAPPANVNFALRAGSPAIGYGTTETWLSPQSVDAGACYHTLTTCP